MADEVMGKRRRVENADLDQEGDEGDEATADGVKRRKREAELKRQVDEYTVRLSPTPTVYYPYSYLTLNNTLANASRSVAAQSARAGGGEGQEGRAGGSCDMGSLA